MQTFADSLGRAILESAAIQITTTQSSGPLLFNSRLVFHHGLKTFPSFSGSLPISPTQAFLLEGEEKKKSLHIWSLLGVCFAKNLD